MTVEVDNCYVECSSFNSATAVTPWMTSTVPIKEEASCPGFNSATAVTPWMTPYVIVTKIGADQLQFGHGGDAVDDPFIRVGPFVREIASIRPRR